MTTASHIERNPRMAALKSPYDQYLEFLRNRMQSVKGDAALTRSARSTAIMELHGAALQFITINQLMTVQEKPGKRHRPATEEEIRERIAACVDGVSIERFVADMVDCGVDEEEAWDAASDAGYGDIELWGITFAEAIRVGGALGIPYAPILARD
jgi:hypothetical protein